MKLCLAYCTILPTYFKFDKEQLAQQWWAQGFVSTEDEARDYFDSMINWSLIQPSCSDLSKTQQTYIMCDNVRHRVQQVADKEYHMMHSPNKQRISEFTHHVSLLINPSCESSLPAIQPSIESVYEAKALYTLMLLVNPADPASIKVPVDLGSKLKCLRTLDLSHLDIHELPSSIGDLKHLRYLSICNTKIQRLPNSVSKLYHLHSLRVRNCYKLIELPKDTRNLTNLHHLDLHLDEDFKRKGSLISMPREIGKLTCLQTLTRFVVSTNSGYGISELRCMKNLHGDLTISNLESVRTPADAKEANLKGKDHLQMLELQWTKDARDLRIEEEVLHHLQPHNNIQELKIGAYSGYSLPSWISDRSFSKLVTIKIYDCKNISELPHLEELPSLKMIYIESLPRWSRWRADDNFASLHDIVIRDCKNLSSISITLPVLENLEIDRCPNLIGLPRLPSLHSLKVKDSGDWIWSSLRCLNSLSSLVLSELSTTTPTVELRNCTSLQHLEISNCKSLCFLLDDWLPPNITYLKIEHCPRLQALPLLNLIALEDLQIQHCGELLSLLMGGLPCLGHFEISECPKISDMPSGGLPAKLQILSIDKCPGLEKWWAQIERTQSLSIWINGDLKASAEEKEIHSGASTSQGRYL